MPIQPAAFAAAAFVCATVLGTTWLALSTMTPTECSQRAAAPVKPAVKPVVKTITPPKKEVRR